MTWSWTVRIQPSDQRSFEYKATLSLSESAGRGRDREPLGPRYLYGQGDLAVFLEDLGAGSRQILNLLGDLNHRAAAEISVDVGDEALEVLLPRRPGEA